jgi:hypothetical protein
VTKLRRTHRAQSRQYNYAWLPSLSIRTSRVSQRCGLVSAGFPSRWFLTSRLISRQVTSSVYVGEKVSDFTQLMRSAAGNVDQFLLSSSRVRCSLARQLFTLSLGVWPYAIEAAARQLSVTSQLGTLSAPAARVRRAEASVGQTRCRVQKRPQLQ